MIKVEIETKDQEFSRAVIRIEKSLGDLKVPMKQAGIYMMSSVDKNFEVQGRPERWKGLSPMTIALRRGPKGVVRILQDTGRLKNSITMALSSDGQEVKVGTSFPYARLLHFGGKVTTPAMTIRPKPPRQALRFMVGGKEVFAKSVKLPAITRTIPPRPFIHFQVPEDLDAIEKIFSDHIEESLRKE